MPSHLQLVRDDLEPLPVFLARVRAMIRVPPTYNPYVYRPSAAPAPFAEIDERLPQHEIDRILRLRRQRQAEAKHQPRATSRIIKRAKPPRD